MISVDRIHVAAQAIDPVFLNTPQYHSETLSLLLGVSVVCKIETANPIGNFKGRGMDWWMRCQKGVTRVVCASAGNLGQALAYAGRRAGVAVEIFAAETANPAKIAAMRRFGAQVHLHGKDFDTAKAEGGNFANKLVSTDATKTIADGIAVRVPVLESLPPLASAVDDMMLVSDEQIVAAMRAYYHYEHVIAEPTGAISLAAAMANAPIDQGKTVVTIVTGANIDPQRREEWLRYNQS